MSTINSDQEAVDQLETALFIALIALMIQYVGLPDDPFWQKWIEQEKLCYRSSGPHLAMPQELRDEAERILTAHGVLQKAPAKLLVFGLTPRQGALTAWIVKLCFISLTLTDVPIGADEPDGTMDSQCMSAGENAFSVLEEIGLTEGNSRFANWTQTGREIVKLFKDEIAQIIKDTYGPESSYWSSEKARVTLFEARMNLWLFK